MLYEENNLEESSITNMSPFDTAWLESVEVVMQKFLNNNSLNIDYAAELLFISPRQFSRKLKKLSGLSPIQYLIELRLQKAKDYFEEKNTKQSRKFVLQLGIQTYLTSLIYLLKDLELILLHTNRNIYQIGYTTIY